MNTFCILSSRGDSCVDAKPRPAPDAMADGPDGEAVSSSWSGRLSFGSSIARKFPDSYPAMVKHSPVLHVPILQPRTIWPAAGAGRMPAARVSGAVPLAGGKRRAPWDCGTRRDLQAAAWYCVLEAPG